MDYWNSEAQRLVRTMLFRAGVRRKQLVWALGQIGVHTTETAIANRIHRGTLSLVFVLQVARALGINELELSSERDPRDPAPPAQCPPYKALLEARRRSEDGT